MESNYTKADLLTAAEIADHLLGQKKEKQSNQDKSGLAIRLYLVHVIRVLGEANKINPTEMVSKLLIDLEVLIGEYDEVIVANEYLQPEKLSALIQMQNDVLYKDKKQKTSSNHEILNKKKRRKRNRK